MAGYVGSTPVSITTTGNEVFGDLTVAGDSTLGPIEMPSGIDISDGEVKWLTGTGEPEGVISALVGSLYANTAAAPGAATLFIKTSGTGSAGWEEAGAGAGGVVDPGDGTNALLTESFSGNGTSVDFTLNNTPASINNTQVYLSGVYQQKSTYSLAGNVITFSEAPPNGWSVEVVIATSVTYEAATYVNVDGDTMTGALRVENNFEVTGDTTLDGNVGIGTDSPSGKLTVDGGSIHLGNNGEGVIFGSDTNTNNLIFGNAASNFIGLQTNNSEAMRIDSSGNVGIGNASPQRELHIGSTDNTTHDALIALNSGGALGSRAGIEWRYEDGAAPEARISIDSSNRILEFDTNGSERMRIDSDGNILIGADTEYELQTGTVDGVGLRGDSGARYFSRDNSSERYQIQFINPNGMVGRIETSGSSTSYVTTSDYRLKTDAQPMTDASARVQALNPVNFEWIVDGSRTDGFLAHEAQSVVPECASGTKDAVDEDGNPEYQGIDQSKLVPLLTAALQEALTEIADLKARVTALEVV